MVKNVYKNNTNLKFEYSDDITTISIVGSMGQRAFKNVNNYLNINISFY
jgi:hypothetical protein